MDDLLMLCAIHVPLLFPSVGNISLYESNNLLEPALVGHES